MFLLLVLAQTANGWVVVIRSSKRPSVSFEVLKIAAWIRSNISPVS